MVQTLCQTSVASKRNLETAFSAGRLVYFPRRQQNVIDLYYFTHFYLAVLDVLSNRTQGGSLFT